MLCSASENLERAFRGTLRPNYADLGFLSRVSHGQAWRQLGGLLCFVVWNSPGHVTQASTIGSSEINSAV